MSETELVDGSAYGARKASFTLAPPARKMSEDDYADDAPYDAKAEVVLTPNPGTLPPDVYEATMGPARAAVRRVLVRWVARESPVLARMQDALRTPFLDKYFVYTSTLGTHTFFMIALPALFFFGHDEMARGSVSAHAIGRGRRADADAQAHIRARGRRVHVLVHQGPPVFASAVRTPRHAAQ
jgi:hypothetical protein